MSGKWPRIIGIMSTLINNKCLRHLHSKIQPKAYFCFDFDKYEYI